MVFLTKHLRAYGGTGEYEGYQIGRLLRDISFSGKGLVSKPANPRSVILNASKAFSVNEQNTISNVLQGEVNMSDNNEEKQLEEVAKAENTVDVSALEATLAEKENDIQVFAAKIASLQETLAAKEEELNTLSVAMKDMEKKEKSRMRKAKLVEAGFEDAEAEESVPLYDSLDDEKFEAVLAAMKKKWGEMKNKMMKKEEKEEKPMATEEVKTETVVAEDSTEELFEEIKTTEATLVEASDDNDEIEAARASVAEWLTNHVLSK